MSILRIVLVLFLFSCYKEKEEGLDSINKLIEDEKFDIAKDQLKIRLSSKRPGDEIVSKRQTIEKRILEFSNDRNRVVWTEDKTVIFRDLANPLVKTMVFSQSPANLSLSSDAEHAIISFPLPNSAGCRMVAVSLVESKESYISNSYISCDHHGAISSDANGIYYFLDDNLYYEKLDETKTNKLILDKKFFLPPAESIKNRYKIYPIGKTFLIFAGNAGVYRLFWLDPKTNEIDQLSEEIATPSLIYGTGKNAFIVVGKIGKLSLQEVKYSAFGKPLLSRLISIGHEETVSWPMASNEEFLSLQNGFIVQWGPGKKKNLPILTNRFWLAARDQIIYEDLDNNLLLIDMVFSEADWNSLELYKDLVEKY
jgi:hypothetical protein